MSRSGYSDDPGECRDFNMYRGTVDRIIEGRRGQAFLRELVSALDTLPVRALRADVFVEREQVCAMGAVAVARGVDAKRLSIVDPEEPESVGKLLGIPRQLAAEIAFENDEVACGDDEDRWHYMHNWATSQIKPQQVHRCSWCMRELTIRRGKVASHKYNGGPCPGSRKPPHGSNT